MNTGIRTIVITGCGGVPALNVVQSLKQGCGSYRIIGLECNKYHIHLAKGFDKKYLVPDSSDPGYVTMLNRIIETEGIEFLHPQPDREVGILSAKRRQIQARMMLPNDEVVQLCHDKFRLIEKLHQVGIPAARSFLIKDPRDLETAMNEIGPKIWVRAIRGAAGRGSLPVEKIDHGQMWIDYWKGWGAFAAEEYLPGKSFGWQAVYKEGKLAGSMAYERIEYVMQNVAPSGVTGGPAICRYTDSDEVHRMGRLTVESVDPCPTGIYGVDLKENAAGVPCVTEINVGRFYSPCLIFAGAGYNLVQLFFELALNKIEVGHYPIRAKTPKDRYWLRGLDVAPTVCHLKRFLEPGQSCE
jgi:hypothetical protein